MEKRKSGEFIGAFPSYGYIKNPKNKHELIIDNSVEYVVRNIFDWYVNEGLGKIAICHRLNDLGILNPTGHKKIELKQKYNNYGIQDNTYTWTPSTVRNILSNEVYIGNTVQGKRKTKSYKIHKVEAVAKEDWIRVENTHEAIIDKKTFEKAQNLNKKDIKISQKTKELSMWAGFLKCYDCKKAMNKKSSTNKTGKTYEYYICSTYRKKSNKLCTKHTIKVENLSKIALQVINLHIKYLINTDKLIDDIKRLKYQNDKNKDIEKIIKLKNANISKLSDFKRNLYEDWKNGDITKEEYIEYKQKYKNDISNIQKSIERLESEKQNNEDKKKASNKWIEELKKQNKITDLSRDIIIELIECIYVKENGDIVIKFNFIDEVKTRN